jgi:peptide/nickel transport system ATP-binding protein
MLKLDKISKVYKVGAFGGTELTAVRDVSFDVGTGEVVSLIGESGSGKSTIGKMILRLVSATAGTITFDGTDVSALKRGGLKDYYRNVQGVFQDPFSCYNPIFKADRVFGMIKDEYFPHVRGAEWREKVDESLRAVRLDPDQVLNKYPHQLSGGQLQRLLIARALLLDIKFLVADEVISMLDASTRIDVLNLLADLKERGLGILFITHDLSLGNYVSDRTVILRRGVIVEMGATEKVFGNPLHPYTTRLLSSVPQLHKKWAQVDVELTAAPGAGDGPECLYHAMYPSDGDGGNGDRPALAEAETGHYVACVRVAAGTDLEGTC